MRIKAAPRGQRHCSSHRVRVHAGPEGYVKEDYVNPQRKNFSAVNHVNKSWMRPLAHPQGSFFAVACLADCFQTGSSRRFSVTMAGTQTLNCKTFFCNRLQSAARKAGTARSRGPVAVRAAAGTRISAACLRFTCTTSCLHASCCVDATDP